jgi:hypothetical protein
MRVTGRKFDRAGKIGDRPPRLSAAEQRILAAGEITRVDRLGPDECVFDRTRLGRVPGGGVACGWRFAIFGQVWVATLNRHRSPMTGDMMNLRALLGRSACCDFLREMIGLAVQPPMAPGVGGLTGAGAGYGAGLGLGGKSDDRLAQRNGHREQA